MYASRSLRSSWQICKMTTRLLQVGMSAAQSRRRGSRHKARVQRGRLTVAMLTWTGRSGPVHSPVASCALLLRCQAATALKAALVNDFMVMQRERLVLGLSGRPLTVQAQSEYRLCAGHDRGAASGIDEIKLSRQCRAGEEIGALFGGKRQRECRPRPHVRVIPPHAPVRPLQEQLCIGLAWLALSTFWRTSYVRAYGVLSLARHALDF